MRHYFSHLQTSLKTGLFLTALLACTAVGVTVVMTNEAPALAQVGTLTISSIQVTAITNSSATITWTTNIASDSVVNYGLNSSYGSSESNSTPVTNHAIIIGNLSPATVYHYQVVSTEAGGASSSSLDRTLTTASGSGNDTTAPNIFNVRVDAINTSATVTFTTNEDTGVKINFGTTTSYGTTVDQSTLFSTNHNVVLSPLNGNTVYHYQIIATDRSGNSTTTSDFNFRTSGSAFDHTFTTGNCSDGTDIGQCNAGGQYCDNGTLIYNCTQCGYSCTAGQTCRIGGVCIQDPPQSGSAYECNPATCYDPDTNAFWKEAPAGCYASWDRCNANIVLKVVRDRVCDKWLSCETGTSVINKNTGKLENLCYNLGGCNQLGADGQCAGVLSKYQCSNDPLTLCNTDGDCPPGGSCIPAKRYCVNNPSKTCVDSNDCGGAACVGGIADVTYQTPVSVDRIQNLTGSIMVGLDWTDVAGSPIIRGAYPWNTMPQLGGKISISNSSFEERSNDLRCDNDLSAECQTNTDCATPGKCIQANVYSSDPWIAWSPSNGFNEENVGILNVWDDNDPNSGNRILQITPTAEEFSGAAAKVTGAAGEAYYVTLDMKTDQSGIKAVVQFKEITPALADATVDLSTSWKRVTIGPARGVGQNSYIRVLCYNEGQPCDQAKIFIDNIEIRPILEIRSAVSDSTGPINSYIAPSCRLYPRGDSQSCEYVDQNGISYRGWYGYCLEEWPTGSGNCISWWPIDLIKGEYNGFGDEPTTGYLGRVPLYYCLESTGRASYNRTVINNNSVGLFDTKVENVSATSPANGYYNYEIGSIRVSSVTGSGTEVGWNNLGITLSAADTQGLNDLQNSNDVAADRTNYWQGCWYRSEANESSASFKCTSDQVKAVQNLLISGSAVHYDNKPDIAIFRVKFNDTTGAIQSWHWWLVDDSSGTGELTFDIDLRSQEVCTKIVKVATEDDNKAWTQNVSDGSVYRIRDLNYGIKTDLGPFGGAVPGEITDPTVWDTPLFAQQPSEDLSFPYQPRSGSPYACVGNCNQRRCMGGKGITILCSSSADCTTTTGVTGVCVGVGTCENSAKACTSDSQCSNNAKCIGGAASNRGAQTAYPYPGGVSSGVCSNNASTFCYDDSMCGAGICVSETFAQQRIMRIFAQSYGMWQWDYNTGHYEFVSGSTTPESSANNNNAHVWYPPSNPCVDINGAYTRSRPPFDPATNATALGNWMADYCGIEPIITNLVISKNNAKSVSLPTGGGEVEFRYTVSADPQQVPLATVRVDWDGNPATTNDYEEVTLNKISPKSSLSDPHILTHGYGACTTAADCVYHPKFQVVDNWGWCNGAEVSGEKCTRDITAWYPLNAADDVTVTIKGTQ